MKTRSTRPSPRSLAALGLLLATLGASCSSTPASPTGPSTKETFSGTIGVGGSASHDVTVGTSSNLTVTLTSLVPQTTITVGLGVGQPDAATGTCVLASYTNSANAGRAITVAVNKGTLCTKIYDVGNILTTVDYTLSVEHY